MGGRFPEAALSVSPREYGQVRNRSLTVAALFVALCPDCDARAQHR